MKWNSTSLRTVIAVLAACVALVLSGCSSSAGGGGAADSVAGTGSVTGDGGLLMVFMPSTSNVYLKAAAEAIKTEADELNYEAKIVENDFDQTEQDQQVQEWLASAEEAEAVLFWPASAAAATNSIRQLSAKAPVIQWNQLVQDDAREFVSAYAGVSDLAMGRQAGVDALGALEELTASGRQWRGPGGKPNLIEIRFTAGYAAGDDRQTSFAEETGDAFNVLAVEATPTVDAQGGFAAASQVIPQYLDEGIDFVYTHSNDVANGVVQALEQNGLKPGEDVIVVAGTSSGDLTNLRSGKIWSAVLQPPVIEGQLVVRTAAQLLAAGEPTSGETTLPPDAEKPELTADPPSETTFMMSPQVTAENIDTIQIWGMSFEELN